MVSVQEIYFDKLVWARQRDLWSLKTRCGMLPSNIALKQKSNSGQAFLFLRHRRRYYH